MNELVGKFTCERLDILTLCVALDQIKARGETFIVIICADKRQQFGGRVTYIVSHAGEETDFQRPIEIIIEGCGRGDSGFLHDRIRKAGDEFGAFDLRIRRCIDINNTDSGFLAHGLQGFLYL